MKKIFTFILLTFIACSIGSLGYGGFASIIFIGCLLLIVVMCFIPSDEEHNSDQNSKEDEEDGQLKYW